MGGSSDQSAQIVQSKKISDYVENHVFKHLDKLNGNIDNLSETVGETVDSYIEFLKNKFINRNTEGSSNNSSPEQCIEYEENKFEEEYA